MASPCTRPSFPREATNTEAPALVDVHAMFAAWNNASLNLPKQSLVGAETFEMLVESLNALAAEILRSHRPELTADEVELLEDYVYETPFRAYSGTAD